MRFHRYLVAAAAAAGVLFGAQAQTPAPADWPTKPLRIIVPFPPGGANDIAARSIGLEIGPSLPQPVVVDNRTGAGGLVGYTAAAQSRDGHTLLMASTSISLLPSLSPGGTNYDLARDFEPVGWVSAFPGVLVVPATSKIKTVQELLAEMRTNPGKVICGNGGIGTSSHLGVELFLSVTKTSCTGVPYRGEGALAPAIMAGEVAMAFSNLPGVLPHIKSGKIRVLAVAATEPSPDLPGVPTLESMGLTGMEVTGWVVLLASKGMPEEAVARLDKLLQQSLASKGVRERFAAGGLVPVSGGRDKLMAYMLREQARWGKLIRERDIKAQ
jgi:tripartite-type tricarboxylate transporter receptor subunit TctC